MRIPWIAVYLLDNVIHSVLIFKTFGPQLVEMGNGIHWINLYPVNDAIQFVNAYPLDSGLSVG